MAEGGDRPLSRNADIHTEPVDELPPLSEARTRKQLRTHEKRRLTTLSKRIGDHMNNFGSRTELQFLRKEMTNQLEECIKAHNLYRQSCDLNVTPSHDWTVKLENTTALWYGRIDEYIRTINLPPSAVASNTESSVHTNPASVHSNPASGHNHPVSEVQSNPVPVIKSKPHPTILINPAPVAQNNPASVVNSVQSGAQSFLGGRLFREPLDPFFNLDRSIASLYEDPSLDFEAVATVRRRLDQEKRARESMEERFQQLQSNFRATNEEINRRNQINAGAPSKQDVDFLMNTVRRWQAAQEEEKGRRISFEQSLEKHRRELEEEKLARQADLHRLEWEKQRELEKLKSSFDEKLERHATTASNNRAPPEDPTQKNSGGARPKHPYPQQPSSSGQNRHGPPQYKEHESNDWGEAVYSIEEKIIDSSSWSFDVKDNGNGPRTNQTGTPVSVFRLPKMDLKPFDGDPKNWQDFFAIFRDLVHNNSSLTTTQKMAILKSCLSAEIRDGLGDSLSSPALYSQALRELKSTYGHPSLISKTYFQSLIQLQQVNHNDYKALLKFSQTVNGAVASLKSGGYSHEL